MLVASKESDTLASKHTDHAHTLISSLACQLSSFANFPQSRSYMCACVSVSSGVSSLLDACLGHTVPLVIRCPLPSGCAAQKLWVILCSQHSFINLREYYNFRLQSRGAPLALWYVPLSSALNGRKDEGYLRFREVRETSARACCLCLPLAPEPCLCLPACLQPAPFLHITQARPAICWEIMYHACK